MMWKTLWISYWAYQMKADKYYGSAARNYDKARINDGTWTAENALIEKLVTEGPVLDVPFGTGRYVPIYEKKGLKYLGIDISVDMLKQAKNKYPSANCRVGSAFNLPTGFKTVVCTRLLNWLYPDELRKAMAQFDLAAETLIFTLRAGIDGDRRATATYTHSINTLKSLIGGRLWEQHRVGGLQHGKYIMVKARKPTWADVTDAFTDRKKNTLDTLAAHWAARMNVEKPMLNDQTPRTVEWWSHDRLAAYMADAIKVNPGMAVDKNPRRDDGPMIAFKREGQYGLLDGRHRATLWQTKPGIYPVMVMEC